MKPSLQTSPNPPSSRIPEVSKDGYIRMTFRELHDLELVHLASGLDEEDHDRGFEAAQHTEITGYTEWITETTPAITIGWDWKLEISGNRPRLIKCDLPRSNIMLISGDEDSGPEITATLLDIFLDSISWQSKVYEQIGLRYA
ncbi:MAG: DUF4902 domain-containing protein [Burkholderiales bacterium]|nr:DUF4902 domain-containing protein [Burkholderiales bacterium]